MSILSVDNIVNQNNNSILSTTGGNIIQTRFVRSDAFTLYSVPPSGDGTTITDLSITITPTSASNRIILQWMINGDMNGTDAVFLIHKNGLLISSSGQEGRNAVSNNRWVGYAGFPYDNDYAGTTPANVKILYSQIAGSTQPITFSPAIRSSSATTFTFYMNRTSTTGADFQENTVCYGFAYEVVV